ncbi:hypothetical protein BGZ60DRAFT_244212 [Tricladium varicosporioides]|nr:hypothetical protein BGZ60DRAFT_244212 [Hymenoscyphus varicosporioides]
MPKLPSSMGRIEIRNGLEISWKKLCKFVEVHRPLQSHHPSNCLILRSFLSDLKPHFDLRAWLRQSDCDPQQGRPSLTSSFHQMFPACNFQIPAFSSPDVRIIQPGTQMQADWRISMVFSADWLAWVRFRNSTFYPYFGRPSQRREHPRNVRKTYATVLVKFRRARIIYFLRDVELPLHRAVPIFVSLAKL